MSSLRRELLLSKLLAYSPAMATVLEQAGLGEPALHWGIDWVEADGPHYRPVGDGGRIALIVGVDQHGGLLDLVATSLETRAMRRRRGIGTLLGEDRIHEAEQFQQPLQVFADPISWLANRRDGVVILDWSDAWSQLFNVPALACESEALALRLRRAFAGEAFAPPALFVPSRNAKEHRHAA